MKIMAVCGTGLGSSFMLEMNIIAVLKDLGIKDIEVSHTDLGSVTNDMADVFIVGLDLESSMSHVSNLIVLNSIIDKKELQSKIEKLVGGHYEFY